MRRRTIVGAARTLAAMAVACPSCGSGNPERAKFCSECAAPLLGSESIRPRETRRTVTLLFADVSGSTAMGEQLDPETLRRVMDRYFGRMRDVIESHGGTVEKYIGDAIMAVFGIPTLHEDDAVRALRAAAGMRDALDDLNAELERERGIRLAARTGVNTGEVVTGDASAGQRLVTGDAVNIAARLEQAAGAGEILLGHPTYRLVRDAVEVERLAPLALKGKAQPLRAYRLVSVAAHGEGRQRHLDSPMVGRDRERALLMDAFARALDERTCNLFTVLGPAGVGKSRLVGEFLGDVEARASVLQGRCLPYGDGITYWPLRDGSHQHRDGDHRRRLAGRGGSAPANGGGSRCRRPRGQRRRLAGIAGPARQARGSIPRGPPASGTPCLRRHRWSSSSRTSTGRRAPCSI